jgi:hypothetical protein
MTLDNSWEIMNEEEMYDVNGGGTVTIKIVLSEVVLEGMLSAAGSTLYAAAGTAMVTGPETITLSQYIQFVKTQTKYIYIG